jgi:flagellar basal-body rod protein FlgC
VNALNTALTGLSAASAQLALTANNLANADTPGYRSQHASLTALPNTDGVQLSHISQDPSPTTPDSSNVDLVRETVDLTKEKLLYTANAKVVAVADHLTGTLLNVLSYNDRRRRDRERT